MTSASLGRVLVTEGDTPAALATVRALRAGGYEPWVLAPQGDSYARRSRATAGIVPARAQPRDGRAFADAVTDALRARSYAAVLPASEAALLVLADALETFPSEVAIGAPPPEIVDVATSKLEVGGIAAEVSVPAPRRALLDDGRLPPGFTYPVIAKPVRSVVRRHDGRLDEIAVRNVRSDGELEAFAAVARDRLLVEEFVSGDLYAVCGVAWNGDCVCACHQLTTRIWPPYVGGTAYATSVSADAGIQADTERLLERIRWSGVFQVQFIRNRTGSFLIDFNPRVYGSMALAVAAGLNLPAIWTDLLLGRTPRVAPTVPGVRYRAEKNDVRALPHALVKRRFRSAPGPAARRTAHQIFSLTDPLPVVTMVRRTFAKAVRSG